MKSSDIFGLAIQIGEHSSRLLVQRAGVALFSFLKRPVRAVKLRWMYKKNLFKEAQPHSARHGDDDGLG